MTRRITHTLNECVLQRGVQTVFCESTRGVACHIDDEPHSRTGCDNKGCTAASRRQMDEPEPAVIQESRTRARVRARANARAKARARARARAIIITEDELHLWTLAPGKYSRFHLATCIPSTGQLSIPQQTEPYWTWRLSCPVTQLFIHQLSSHMGPHISKPV